MIMEDAAQMAALQIHAEFGPTLLDLETPDAFEAAIERFITKQVRVHFVALVPLLSSVTLGISILKHVIDITIGMQLKFQSSDMI